MEATIIYKADNTKDKLQEEGKTTTDDPLREDSENDASSSVEDNHLGCNCVTCALKECIGCTGIFDSFNGDLKVHMIPQAKNAILIRLENIADLFDGKPAETPYFDLQKYAEELFMHSNDGMKPISIQITERTLGNSEDYAEMEKAMRHERDKTGVLQIKCHYTK